MKPQMRPYAGAGCGIVMILLAVAVVAAGGLAYRYGPHWWWVIIHSHPPGVVIHHSATDSEIGGRRVDAELIDRVHQRRGWGMSDGHQTYHIGYHYVILPDGTVQKGRPEWMPGAHTSGYNQYLGVCVIGDFCTESNPQADRYPAHPTDAQIDALVELLYKLAERHGFGVSDIHPHSALGATCCPGDRFPIGAVKEMVDRRLGAE